MMVKILKNIRDRYESETGKYFDEWIKDTTFSKMATWDYVIWLENKLRKFQKDN